MVAHRIVANSKGAYWRELLTQGDALADADTPVSAGDLLGRVDFILRNGRQARPSRRLRIHERAVTALTRKSALAARGIVRLRRFYKSLQESARNIRANSCCH